MIRTVQQWLESTEFRTLAKGGALAAFIEAVQRDARASGYADAVEEATELCNEEQEEARATGNTDYMAACNVCALNIRALIPPKPKETP